MTPQNMQFLAITAMLVLGAAIRTEAAGPIVPPEKVPADSTLGVKR